MDDTDAGVWLIVSDLARRLQRPDSTVRHWRDVYRASVPSRRNERGQIEYPLAIFERIRRMSDAHYTPREIQAQLPGEQPAAEMPPALVTLEDIARTLAAQDEMLAEIRAAVDRIERRLPQ